jgi:hypothetical protein
VPQREQTIAATGAAERAKVRAARPVPLIRENRRVLSDVVGQSPGVSHSFEPSDHGHQL